MLFHIDKLCSETTGVCFIVTDRYEMISERLFAYRGLRILGNANGLLLSEARIIPPLPITWRNFNSKTWKLHKKSVRLSYAQMMIAGSFFSGALDYYSRNLQNILIIGLGGGIINNYFSTMDKLKLNVTIVDNDPVMKIIAKKWYEFKETSMQRIIVDDGLRYIREANKRDVSYNEIRPLIAPVEEFLADDEIAEMKKVLKNNDMRAVIVNIVARQKDNIDRVHFVYSRHFPSCYLMQFIRYNKMLFCSKKEKNSWLDNRDELYNRFKMINKELEFNLIEENNGKKKNNS